ncbi:hypothetical protein BK143_02505 [Paenibacillus peoriae]|uniref:AAA family ATPase n=1 Tax=Paenibacillus peoriae TaxID=59893 RepID=UPI00096DF9CA|nr:AAA family ATPase [Paenibacillus peoriae]OMF75266.1 hypothetical protein BK143_02505 [Paenibacillus peoriae]
MKLIYTWIKRYRNLERLELNWDREFEVKMEDNVQNIFIRRNKNIMKLFPKYIENITAVVGKNGTGKSNILNLLSQDVKTLYQRKIDLNRSEAFFNLYHIKNNHYAIEGIWESISSILNGIQEEELSTKFCVGVKYDEKSKKFIFKRYWYEEFSEEKPAIAYLRYVSRSDEREEQGVQSAGAYKPYRYWVDRRESKLFSKAVLINDINNLNGTFKHIFFKEKPIYTSITKGWITTNESISFKSMHGIDIFKIGSQPSTRDYKRNFILGLLEGYNYNCFDSLLKDIENREERIKQITMYINNVNLINDRDIEYYLEVYKYLLMELKNEERLNEDEVNKYYLALEEAVGLLCDFDEEVFYSNDEIRLTFASHYGYIAKLTKLIDKYRDDEHENYLTSLIVCHFKPFSTGEKEIIDLFAAIYHGLRITEASRHEHVVLVLDEPNNFMHPEWSRRLIHLLLEFLRDIHNFINASRNTSIENTNNSKYSIIIATHSPFVLSDLSEEHIIALEIDPSNENSEIRIKKNMYKTFASNIHTLFSHSLFMDTTIGEFAKGKINSIISRLNQVVEGKGEKLSDQEKKEFEFVIGSIGEPLISNKIQELYLNAISEKELQKQIIEEKILKWQQKLKELEEI